MQHKERVSRRGLLIGVGAAAAALAGSGLLAACGGTPTPAAAPTTAASNAAPTTEPAKPTVAAKAASQPAEKVKMAFWFWGSPDEKASNDKITAAFNSQSTTSEVQNVQVTWEEFNTKFETAVAGGQPPDAFYVNESAYARQACNSILLDWQPYLKALGIDPKKKWHPLAQYWWNGKFHGPALALESHILLYNNDLFTKAGLPEAPFTPQTAWDRAQFLDVARKLTLDSNGKHPGESGFDRTKIQQWGILPFRAGWALPTYLWQSDLQAFGPNFDKNNITNAEIVEMFQFIADLAAKENVSPLPTDMTGTNGNVLFLTGKIAMQMNGQWSLQELTAKKPNFDLRLGVIPKFGKKFMAFNTGAPAAVYSKSKVPDEAMKFCLYFADNNNALINLQTGLWMGTEQEWLTGSKRKLWVDDYPEHHPPHFVDVAIGSLEASRQMEWKRWSGYNEAWNQIVTAAMDNVWIGKTSAADAMKSISPKLDELVMREAKNCPAPTEE